MARCENLEEEVDEQLRLNSIDYSNQYTKALSCDIGQ